MRQTDSSLRAKLSYIIFNMVFYCSAPNEGVYAVYKGETALGRHRKLGRAASVHCSTEFWFIKIIFPPAKGRFIALVWFHFKGAFRAQRYSRRFSNDDNAALLSVVSRAFPQWRAVAMLVPGDAILGTPYSFFCIFSYL